LLTHLSLSVLFTAQSGTWKHDYSEWKEKLEKLANDFYFKDISSKVDIEKRVKMVEYQEDGYEFLAFLANANTEREKSIFAIYEELTSVEGLSKDCRRLLTIDVFFRSTELPLQIMQY